MKKYLALYCATPELFKKWTSEETKDENYDMDSWMRWGKSHGMEIADMGAPVGKNTRLTNKGASAMSNAVGGYSIVQADSIEAAEKIFNDCPHLNYDDAYIELMEIREM